VGKIAINASAAEFREPGFADRLLARLAAFDIPPAMLELEITETAFLGDCAANVVAALEALRAAGMTIALDDFGTGFSSLSHLRNFPVDTIKIDRSFVAGLGDSAEDRAIIEAVLRLGEALGMTTVAEGVETEAQADYLRAHGCTLAQGFLYAPALDGADVPAAAEAHHAALAVVAAPAEQRAARPVETSSQTPPRRSELMAVRDDIREGMEVIGADGVHVGTVDRIDEKRIKLTRPDSGEGSHEGHHHYLSVGLVADVEGDKVRLSAKGDVAATLFEEEEEETGAG